MEATNVMQSTTLPKGFVLKNSYFDFESNLHGINHTYRVMCHCLILGRLLNLKRETKLAFCGAFIHDMARQHDSFCSLHGRWAADTKLRRFIKLFKQVGVQKHELEEIKAAVANHSESEELYPLDEYFKTTALLKDADALDRIRLGEDNLRVNYLRFKESLELVKFAQHLYYETETEEISSFKEVLDIAGSISEYTLDFEPLLEVWF